MTKQMFDGRDIGAFIPSTLDDFGLDPYQFRVYCRIVRRAGNGACFESVNNIAEACRMDRNKVFSSLKFLLAHRLIEKEPTPKKGATVNYHLTPSSEWIHIEKPEKKPRGVPNMVHPPVPNMVHPPVPNMVHPPVPNMVHKGTPIEGTPIEGTPIKERERALSLSDDFSFSENQDGAEQENPGSQDLDQSPPEDSTFVNEEDLNSQKNESCAPPQNNEAWDVDVLNKIWEANRSPKWKPSSLLILTKFISAGLDQFLATAGGNRSEAYRLIGIAIAQMSTDEFYGTRDRRLSEVLHFDPQQPCKTFCGHWLGAALEVAGGAKKPAAEKPIEKLTHDISDRLIPRIAETNVADPHAKPDTKCPECGMRSRAFEVERYGTCAFCWQKSRTHHSPVGLIAKTD